MEKPARNVLKVACRRTYARTMQAMERAARQGAGLSTGGCEIGAREGGRGLASQRKGEHGQIEERSKREERADRILDAAAELIERWGYNKTTIDDIARQAGVAKGTIYLHWKTRDDLFWTLLTREDIRLAERLQQRIASDPEGMTLHGLIKHIILVTMKSPLAKAMLLMDSNMLGQLARRDYSSASFPERMAGFRDFLTHLRDQGAIRADIDIQEQIYMLSAIVMGYLMIDQWMPDDFTYSDEEIADMAAESIRRTLEPRETEQATTGTDRKQAIERTFTSFMDQAVEIRKREIQKEEEVTS
jgi:AcrR family transcriptional regulator